MSDFIELTQTKGQGRGTTLISVEAIDRIRSLFVAPNLDVQTATILTLRNGEVVYVAESYDDVVTGLRRFAGVFRLVVFDQP